MPGIAVIGENAYGALNPATPLDYGAIYEALGGDTSGHTALLPARAWINGAGEALVPAFQPWTPELVAGAVQSGEIWIDYCGWPMYQLVNADGTIDTLGSSGFARFAKALGYPWLEAATFNVGFNVPGSGSFAYPFVRGWGIKGSQNGVCLPQGSFVTPGGVLGIGGGSATLQASGFAAMMALTPPGGGYYFYGVYTSAEEQLAGGQVPGYGKVPPDLYAAFILAVIGGQSTFSSTSGSGTITCLAYQIPQTTPSGNSPPTNPYPEPSPSPTPTPSPYGSGTPTPSTPSTVDWPLVGGIAVAVAVVGGTAWWRWRRGEWPWQSVAAAWAAERAGASEE